MGSGLAQIRWKGGGWFMWVRGGGLVLVGSSC